MALSGVYRWCFFILPVACATPNQAALSSAERCGPGSAPPATTGPVLVAQDTPEKGPSTNRSRPVTGPSDPGLAASFSAGQRVSCRWKNGSVAYPGQVRGISEGRLLVDYDDGDKEAITPALCSETKSAAAVAASGTGRFVGNWRITLGKNPTGGSTYRGTVDISRLGEPYFLNWTIGSNPGYRGVALDMGKIMAVGWSQQHSSFGVVAYEVRGGHLKGSGPLTLAEASLELKISRGPRT